MMLLQSEKKPEQGAFGAVKHNPSPRAIEPSLQMSSPRTGDIEVIDASIGRPGTQQQPDITASAGQLPQITQALELVDIVEVDADDSATIIEPELEITDIANRISEILKSKKRGSSDISDDRVKSYMDSLRGDKQNRITLAKKLKDEGISAVKLRQIGFSFTEIIGAGFSDSSLLSATQRVALSIKSFSSPRAQVLAKMYHEIGIPASELTEYFNLGDLRIAGYTAKELIDSGCPISKLRRFALLSADDLRKENYSAKQLREAKDEVLCRIFNDNNILGTGFDAVQLVEAGFSKEDLIKAGYTAERFERANSIVQLKRKGYTAKKLKTKGFTIAEVWNAGFNRRDLIGAEYDLRKVVNLPPFVGQIVPRDISGPDIFEL